MFKQVASYVALLVILLAILYLATKKESTVNQEQKLLVSPHQEFFSSEYFQNKIGGQWTSETETKSHYKKRLFQDSNKIFEISHEDWTFLSEKDALIDHQNKLESRGGIESGQKYSIMAPIENPPNPITALPLVFVTRGPSDTVRMMLSVVAADQLKNYEKAIVVFCQGNTIHKFTFIVRDPENKVDPMMIAQQATKQVLMRL
jgi:hypothetical protein